ncbi:MAG: hypothetical protein IKS32_08015 [Solobacterium sp.]|nr:hypothetical protein [Solobacterium sp.]
MIENLGDAIALICILVALFYAVVNFYNGLIRHREQYFQSREERYYQLFDDSEEDDDYDERNEPYYED